ncbi:MAG TPA: ATP-binding cassette domain-containing protein [Pedococcus sp.]|nr:ATP-binding cassette domain-containing protein [Pedococcus sp.]
MIEIRHLSKRYGDVLAVDDISFDVPPGMVTGFLGPNGAGKSTTMRAIVGLDRPTGGSVRVNGRSYAGYRAPLTEVGSLLEAKAVHPGRSAYNHLLFLARSNGIGRARVSEVIEQVGLGAVARKRAGTFSLGMGQRLGIAAALLGDPGTMIFDEPVNGLDPEGIIWVRNLLKGYAAQGRAVLVSSHLMAEMALTANRLVIIGRGRLIADTSVEEFIRAASGEEVLVRSSDQPGLAAALAALGADLVTRGDGSMLVQGLAAARVGAAAAARGTVLHELTPQQRSLEEAFMQLTAESVEFHASPQPGLFKSGSKALR